MQLWGELIRGVDRKSSYFPLKSLSVSSIASILGPEDNYIQTSPIITKEGKQILRGLENQLNSFLWAKKKSDVLEAGLTPFLTAVEIWMIAQTEKSMIVVPFSNPTSAFSRLINLLVEDRRETVGCLSEDIELWFFSHFADIYEGYLYFYNFDLLVASAIKNDSAIHMYHKELCELRESYLFDAEKRELNVYEKKLANFQINQRQLLCYISQKYRRRIINTEVSLAPSRKNIEILRNPAWKCDSFGRAINKVKRSDSFTPYFMNFSFYPSELLKSLREPALASAEVNPVAYFRSFEIASKAELKLALVNYRKRVLS